MVFVQNGVIRAMGYAPYHYKKMKPEKWIDYLDIIQDDRDARNILNLFMRKNDKHTIINYS
jgi:sulfur transfer complex TusBCD TusB component (DsrH family)